MIISAVKQQVKNENRVSIFVDGKYSFSLSLDQLLEEKLKKGDELDEARLKQLKKLSDEGKLKARAMEWLMGRPHSTSEFRDYLYKKKAEKELIEAWTVEFSEKGYLDDVRFAEWFAEKRIRKHKSDREITAELASKGISREVTEEVLKPLRGDSSEADSLHQLITKLQSRSRYADQDKLVRYLQSKGYKYSDIRDALQANA